MARSVVLGKSPRCQRCLLQPRWCICDGLRTVTTALAVDLLVHQKEVWKPSSTGHLILRTVTSARRHIYSPDVPFDANSLLRAGRDLWILHPQGDEMPVGQSPEEVQVVLLDGSWRQATDMMHMAEKWARPIRLPMTGVSRYWLRSQADGGRFSTAEALLFVLQAFGLHDAADVLRMQFELHVYASLRARGKALEAERFLHGSPLGDAFPDVLRRLAKSTREQIKADDNDFIY